MRYDFRRTATHPTIPSDQLICTYPFPLLSNKAHLEKQVATATGVFDAPALAAIPLRTGLRTTLAREVPDAE